MSDFNSVITPSNEYSQQACLWSLPRTLMGGTRAMRHAGHKYLPLEQAESVDAYKARLLRTTLFNAFRKTVSDMTGKVFRREVQLGTDMPQELKTLAENVDNSGRHLNVFARDLFFDGMQVGISFLYVDMPPPIAEGNGTGRNGEVTAADTLTRRPYFCMIKAENLIGWKVETIEGNPTLMQARILEEETQDVDAFNTRCIQQVRVLSPGAWQVYRQSETGTNKGDWILYKSGVTTLSYIPLTPFYANRSGFFQAIPPLEDLADLNLAHWQSQSDQKNILHVARVPILFMAGWKEDDKIEIGAARACRSSDPNAKMEYVEHTGAAIGAGDKDLQNLESQMQTQGLQLLTALPGSKTATGEIHDSEKENSPLAMMAGSLNDVLETGFGFMADYLGMGVDKGGSVTVNKDFGISATTTVDVPNIIAATGAGIYDKGTALREFQRRDFLAATEDVEKILAAAKTEQENLGDGIGPGNGMNLGTGTGKPETIQASDKAEENAADY